jgi:ubiquinone/menaquinone biosynthesis C-methylase UbiE
MENPFDSERMAAGYARWRPAVHPFIIDRIRKRLHIEERIGRVLDVGCGAGFSTAPLESVAGLRIGMDPSQAMLRHAAAAARGAHFVAGTAEALPLRAKSVGLITAAGSLNWADPARFISEARRVLSGDGTLVIYDFGQGLGFPELAQWDAEFKRRYPPPACLEIGPESLVPEPYGMRIREHETFDIPVTLTPEFYLEYALTEINVDEAVKRGVPADEIRAWCRSSLEPVFGGAARDILFSGYILYLVALR